MSSSITSYVLKSDHLKKRTVLGHASGLRRNGYRHIDLSSCISDEYKTFVYSIVKKLRSSGRDFKNPIYFGDFNAKLKGSDIEDVLGGGSKTISDGLLKIRDDCLSWLTDTGILDTTMGVSSDPINHDDCYVRRFMGGHNARGLKITPVHNDIAHFVLEDNKKQPEDRHFDGIVDRLKEDYFEISMPYWNIVIFLHALEEGHSHLWVKPGSHLNSSLTLHNEYDPDTMNDDSYKKFEVNGFSMLVMNFALTHFASEQASSVSHRVSMDTRTKGILLPIDAAWEPESNSSKSLNHSLRIRTFCNTLNTFMEDIRRLQKKHKSIDPDPENVTVYLDNLRNDSCQVLFLLSRIPIVRHLHRKDIGKIVRKELGGNLQLILKNLQHILSFFCKLALRALIEKEKIGLGDDVEEKLYTFKTGEIHDLTQLLQALKCEYVSDIFFNVNSNEIVKSKLVVRREVMNPQGKINPRRVKDLFRSKFKRMLEELINTRASDDILTKSACFTRWRENPPTPLGISNKTTISDSEGLFNWIVWKDIFSSLYSHSVVTREDDEYQENMTDFNEIFTIMQTISANSFQLLRERYPSDLNNSKILEIVTHLVFACTNWFEFRLNADPFNPKYKKFGGYKLVWEAVKFLVLMSSHNEIVEDIEYESEIIMCLRSLGLHRFADVVLIRLLKNDSNIQDFINFERCEQKDKWWHSVVVFLAAVSPMSDEHIPELNGKIQASQAKRLNGLLGNQIDFMDDHGNGNGISRKDSGSDDRSAGEVESMRFEIIHLENDDSDDQFSSIPISKREKRIRKRKSESDAHLHARDSNSNSESVKKPKHVLRANENDLMNSKKITVIPDELQNCIKKIVCDYEMRLLTNIQKVTQESEERISKLIQRIEEKILCKRKSSLEMTTSSSEVINIGKRNNSKSTALFIPKYVMIQLKEDIAHDIFQHSKILYWDKKKLLNWFVRSWHGRLQVLKKDIPLQIEDLQDRIPSNRRHSDGTEEETRRLIKVRHITEANQSGIQEMLRILRIDKTIALKFAKRLQNLVFQERYDLRRKIVSAIKSSTFPEMTMAVGLSEKMVTTKGLDGTASESNTILQTIVDFASNLRKPFTTSQSFFKQWMDLCQHCYKKNRIQDWDQIFMDDEIPCFGYQAAIVLEILRYLKQFQDFKFENEKNSSDSSCEEWSLITSQLEEDYRLYKQHQRMLQDALNVNMMEEDGHSINKKDSTVQWNWSDSDEDIIIIGNEDRDIQSTSSSRSTRSSFSNLPIGSSSDDDSFSSFSKSYEFDDRIILPFQS